MLDKNTSSPITSSWKRVWSSTSAACPSTTTLLGWTNHHHRPLIGIVNRMHLIIPVEQNVCIPKEDGDNRWIETIFIGDHRTHRRIIITTNHQPPRKNISALELTDWLTDCELSVVAWIPNDIPGGDCHHFHRGIILLTLHLRSAPQWRPQYCHFWCCCCWLGLCEDGTVTQLYRI